MNHLKNFIISGLFLGLVSANPDGLFAVIHLPLSSSGGLVFGDGLDNPIPACFDALLGP
jgi:hypothetical protein